MGNKLTFFLVVFCIGLYGAVAYINKPHPFDKHIKWLVENSEFEYNGETYPSIDYYESEELQTIAYGKEKIENTDSGSLPKIKALYDHRDNTLMFTKGMDITEYKTAYIVVHELVHFLQNINGITENTECIQSLEEPAYKLQAEWQRQHDHPGPYPNFLFVRLLSLSCSR